MTQGGGQSRLVMWLVVLAALAAVVVAGYLVLRGTSGVPALASFAATPTPTRAPVALWDAFEQAQMAARAKAADVRLVSASTQWQGPSEQALVAGAADWSFVFYTPSEKSSVDVVADVGTVQVVKLTRAWVAPRTLEEGPWRAGPHDALLVFLAYEGSDFLAQHPRAVVDLNLAESKAGGAVWTIVALDAEARQYLALVIDAVSGEVLRREKADVES